MDENERAAQALIRRWCEKNGALDGKRTAGQPVMREPTEKQPKKRVVDLAPWGVVCGSGDTWQEVLADMRAQGHEL